jgi:ATP-binding cassette subfamily C (CFTR/MRP) protein 1
MQQQKMMRWLPPLESVKLWFNRCTFATVEPLFEIGKKRAVTLDDANLDKYPDGAWFKYDMKQVSNQIEDLYLKSGGSMMKAFHATVGLQFYALIVIKLFMNLMHIISPVILSRLILMFEEDRVDLKLSMWYCGLCLLLSLVYSSINSFYWMQMLAVSRGVKSGINSTLYNKSLKLSSKSRGEKSAGEIVNLLGDSDRVLGLLYDIQGVCSSVFNIISMMYVMYRYIGNAVFSGISVVIILSFANFYMAKKQDKLYTDLQDMRDNKAKVVTDMLTSIRVIKMFVWESLFSSKLSQLKKEEDDLNYESRFIDGVQGFMWSCIPFFSGATCLLWFTVVTGQKLNNSLIFAVMEMVGSLNSDFQCLPSNIHTFIEARLAIQRLRAFMNMEEMESVPREQMDSTDIKFMNASFGWNNAPFLNGIDLEIKKGQFVAIVGGVGSGKSSLLSAILGEIARMEGSISINKDRKIAYIEQSPFIRSQSLKDNILFGSTFDKTRYQQVLSVTTLDEDLQQLVNGENTMIGEKGINLSGGQKLRVSLARGLYNDSDIYLLDDPLAAVDYKVGQHIFTHAICNYLSGKTRILVTNQVQYLHQADTIIVMKNGAILERGTFTELINTENSEFKSLMDLTSANITHHEDSQTAKEQDDENSDEEPEVNSSDDESKPFKEDANTIEKMKIITSYLLTYSWKMFAVYVLVSLGSTGFQLVSNYFLASWGSDQDFKHHSSLYYCGLYLFFGGLHLICSLSNALLSVQICLKAAELVHKKLLQRVLSATTTFFDVTPCGKLMRSFGKDILSLDDNLSWQIRCLFYSIGVMVFSSVVIFFYGGPVLLVYVAPLLYYVYEVQKKFRCVAMDSMSSELDANIYSHFSETLHGSVTIRAYSEQDQFQRQNIDNIQNYSEIDIFQQLISAWFGWRMDLVRSLILCLSCLTICQSDVSAVTAVLVIRYSLSFSSEIQWIFEVLSYLDPHVRCIQRLQRVCEETPVENQNKEEVKLSSNTRGHIVFESVTMNYANNPEPALDNITLEIKSSEKIGVAGRTGSGKSSLFSTLLRLYELSSGRILIDGQDISQMPLEQLRKIVAIIPQDPILLSGSPLRQNLDPHNEHSDDAIWEALDRVCMKDRVNMEESKLSLLVAENGKNFSQGERQLLCMARTLLLMMRPDSPIRVLLMDEVSASVDLKTDAIIKQTVNKYFIGCTVLAIAHRLDHLIKFSDRMLVLADGKVSAFDDVDKILHLSEQTEIE